MPTYRITDPVSGKTLRIEGPNPPSEAVIKQMFAQANKIAPPVDRGTISKSLGIGPSIGSTIGGIVAGPAGAALGGAAGEGYEQAVSHAREIPGAVADVARNLIAQPRATIMGAMQGASEGLKDATVAGAVQGGMDLAGGKVMEGIGSAGKAVYRGYLKPSLATKNLAKAQAIVDTALSEGLPMTSGGVAKSERLIGELKQEVDAVLAKSPETVDLSEIADRVRAFARKKYYKPGADLGDYNAVLKVADRIDQHPTLGIPAGSVPASIDVPLTKANETKRALQSSAASSYGVPGAAATKQGEKEAARLTREAIESKTGGVAGTVAVNNARESKLLDAARAIRRAVERDANQNPVYGVKSLVAAGTVGGGTYASTHDPWTAAAAALGTRLALTAAVMSRAAIIASRLGKTSGAAPAVVARLAILAASESNEAEQ